MSGVNTLRRADGRTAGAEVAYGAAESGRLVVCDRCQRLLLPYERHASHAQLCRTAATRQESWGSILDGWVLRSNTTDIMIRKIAIGLAALAMATAGSTLTAPALPGGGSHAVAQSVGHADNNIDKVVYRRWGRRGVIVQRKFAPAYGFRHPVLGRGVVVHHHHVW
jgi:hypothetical protein